MKLKYYIWLLLLGITVNANSQARITRSDYIDRYKTIAIKEMNKFRIPASITLAQGILESGNGNSALARKANNHFGIKCHKSWKGKTFTHDDDRPNECFRKYANAEQSFYDHSTFLAKHDRYRFLFELNITDYKSWARGLKKAGYATNSQYDKLLIKIIEENRLFVYDSKKKRKDPEPGTDPIPYLAEDVDDYSINPFGNDVITENRINYVVVKGEDTFESIAEKHDVRPWQLYKYNELTKGAQLVEGQKLYLQPKRKKADVSYKTHTLQTGESMYLISQKYGIRLSSLYKINRMEFGAEPQVGASISLRKKVKKK